MKYLLSPLLSGRFWLQAAIVLLFAGMLFDASSVRQAFAQEVPLVETYINEGPNPVSARSDATFSFEGVSLFGFDITKFNCQLDGGGFTPCTTPKSYAGLADGDHVFDVQAVDDNGNVDPEPYSYPWTIDTAPPETTISDGPPPTGASADVGFSFEGNDGAGSGLYGFECQLNRGGYSECFGGKEYNGLADGSYTFEVRSIDAAGNPDQSPAAWPFTIDTTPPNTSITKTPAGVSNSTSASFEFGGADPGGYAVTSYECQLDGAGFFGCVNPQNYSGLPNGSHTFEVFATDAAGNFDLTPASFTWTVNAPTTGTPVGACGGYTVLQTAPGQYIAAGWSGAIKVGTNANNTIIGGSGPDLILGLGGDDKIDGKGGADVICGGDGKDQLEGGDGNDYLDGGTNHDLLSGQQGDFDVLYGGDGNDGLFDTDGVDGIHGGKGTDLITFVLRNGWRNRSGATSFDQKLSGGYQDDVVIFAILDRNAFSVNITGDERDNQPSQEGRHDTLALAGRLQPRPTIIKFEHQLVRSAGVEATDQVAAMEAQYAAEYGFTLGEASDDGEQPEENQDEEVQDNRILLPLVTK